NYLALAERYENYRFRTRADVQAVHAVNEGYAVEFVDGLCGGARRRAEARYVFLCAGVFGSQSVLARSRDRAREHRGEGLAHVSDRLGERFFTNNDDTALALTPDTSLRLDDGPTITSSVAYHPPSGGVVLVQDGGLPAELSRFMDPFFTAPVYLDRNRYGARVGDATPVEGETDAGDAGLIDELLRADLGHSGIEQLVLAWLTGDLPDALPRQLRDVIPDLRSQLVERTRHDFGRAIDKLLDRSAATVVDRFTLGRAMRWPKLRARLIRGARQLGERLLIDRDALVEQAQQSFLRYFLVLDPRQEVRRRLGDFYRSRMPHGRMFLLSMGAEPRPSKLQWSTDRLQVVGGEGPFQTNAQLARRAMRDLSNELGAELRLHPFSSLARKRMTVHPQGGAVIGTDAESGVVSDVGEVFGHPGLFIFDASTFPTSVGVNPSATVLAVAERNALAFVRERRGAAWPLGDDSPGAREFHKQQQSARSFAKRRLSLFPTSPPERVDGAPDPGPRALPIGLAFSEELTGAFHPSDIPTGMGERWCLRLRVRIPDLDRWLDDSEHVAEVAGTFTASALKCSEVPVHGRVRMFPSSDGGFHYEVEFDDGRGRLSATKTMKPTQLRATELQAATMHAEAELDLEGRRYRGQLHVSIAGLLTEQLPGLEVTGTSEAVQIAWTMARFAQFFAGGLMPDPTKAARDEANDEAPRVPVQRRERRSA
ncbi:MAG: GMC oxidoreductase, partial [Myxococcota bacterium]